MRIHHATAAKAAKLGFVLEDKGSTVRCSYNDLTIVHGVPTQIVEDMQALKMLKNEYPELKATMVADPLSWSVYLGKVVLGSHQELREAFINATEHDLMQPKKPKRKPKKAKLVEDEDEGEDEDEDEGEGEGEGEKEEEEAPEVIKSKYRERYKPFNDSCGDQLAMQMVEEFSYTDTVVGKDGRERTVTRIDLPKLRNFAELNGVWQDKYSALNPGMQRMNIANRLRGKVRNGHEIVWP